MSTTFALAKPSCPDVCHVATRASKIRSKRRSQAKCARLHSPSPSWSDIPSCQGCTRSEACTCSNWCNNVPANSWETVPDCCGCHAGVPSNLPLAPSPAAVSASSGVSPTPGPPWQTTAACNANAACRAQGLDGDCCPNSAGSMLGCCSER